MKIAPSFAEVMVKIPAKYVPFVPSASVMNVIVVISDHVII